MLGHRTTYLVSCAALAMRCSTTQSQTALQLHQEHAYLKHSRHGSKADMQATGSPHDA